jgi:hypothetical protein
MSLISTLDDEVSNISALIFNPSKFFEEMQTKSSSYMMRYLFIASIPLFVGYFLNLYFKAGFPETEFKCSEAAAVESAIISVLTLVLTVPTASLLLSLISKNLFEKRVGADEIATLIGYPMAIVLLSGILRAHVYTVFLHYGGIGYGVYLLYSGISVRYGFDKALMNFIVFLLAMSLVLIIIAGALISTFSIILAISDLIGLSSIIPIINIPSYCY